VIEPDDVVQGVLESQSRERDALGNELLTELWAAMPWGHKFRLSNGGEAELVELNGGRGNSKPKKDHDGWRMLFDFKLTGSIMDHVEVKMYISGGGGIVPQNLPEER
jgi:hypothetical protein